MNSSVYIPLSEIENISLPALLDNERVDGSYLEEIISLLGLVKENIICPQSYPEDSSSEVKLPHDRKWLGEALINIIKNAIEHTEENGKVEIVLTSSPASCRIEVRDHSEGISEEDLPFVFQRFYKGKSSKKSDSVGIGLALSKSIIEGHGGFIQVASNEDAGVTFSISFLKI